MEWDPISKKAGGGWGGGGVEHKAGYGGNILIIIAFGRLRQEAMSLKSTRAPNPKPNIHSSEQKEYSGL